MKHKIIPFTIALCGLINIFSLSSIVSAARIPCDTKFLGLNAWNCDIEENMDSEDILKQNIWIIVANISKDITIVAAYLVLGYVIYGGYLYMLSSGDAGKVASGKKTLVHAFIGLAIVMLANIIVDSIRIALLGSSGKFSNCEATNCVNNAGDLVTNLLQWVIGITGIVAVAFVVIGGISYITSAGDPGKIQKAKSTILYAIIGLVIVALAQVITAFVSSTIRNSTSTINNYQTIAKEHHNEKNINHF